MEIIVHKSKKILEVWENGQLMKSYPIAVGKDSKDHKEREGDMRTPEGEYRVCVKNPKSKYHLSLGINYPNEKDAESGLRKGLISKTEYDAICDAKKEIPPWKTALGGEIYIHGNLEKQNWTHGCVRMNDPDIEELFGKAQIGTKVIIKG